MKPAALLRATPVLTVEQRHAIADALDQAERAIEAVNANPHVSLADLVYKVRESELLGWEGPAVKQWQNAVVALDAALAKLRGAPA